MFDPRLTVRLWGLRVATRASCVVVLAVVIGGVLNRLAAAEGRDGGGFAWFVAVVLTFSAVATALLGHEFARVWIARWQGATVRRIDIALFGGSSNDVNPVETPRAEAIGALITYAMLVGMAGIVAVAALLTRQATLWMRVPVKTATIAVVALVALQALPALHLDGGRVFHAWFWYLTESSRAATVAAALYTHLVAAFLVGGGIVLLARTGEWPFWGLAAAAAGLQLEGAARRTARQDVWIGAAGRLTLRELSLAPAVALAAQTTIDDAFDVLVGGRQGAYLLIFSADREPIGVLRMADLRGTRRILWDRMVVAEVMTPVASLPSVGIDTLTKDVLTVLEESGGVAAIEDAGRIVNVVTRGQVLVALADRRRERPEPA